MKKIIYIVAMLLSVVTLVVSTLTGKSLTTILERSMMVFLVSLALFVVFAHLLSWGLKVTSLKTRNQNNEQM